MLLNLRARDVDVFFLAVSKKCRNSRISDCVIEAIKFMSKAEISTSFIVSLSIHYCVFAQQSGKTAAGR